MTVRAKLMLGVAGLSLLVLLLFAVLPWPTAKFSPPQGNPVAGIKTSMEPIFAAPNATRAAVGCTGSRCLVCVVDEFAKVNCYLVRLDTGKGPVR